MARSQNLFVAPVGIVRCGVNDRVERRALRHHPAQNLVGQVVDGPGITSTTWPQPLEFLTPPRNIGGMLRATPAPSLPIGISRRSSSTALVSQTLWPSNRREPICRVGARPEVSTSRKT